MVAWGGGGGGGGVDREAAAAALVRLYRCFRKGSRDGAE